LLVVAPERLRLLELGAGAAGDEHLLPDHGLHDLDDALDGRVRPAALLQVLQSEPDLVAALLDRRVDQERAVVGRRLLAVDEEVLALLLRLLAEVERLVPGLRRGPAVLLEERLRVPDAVHGHHVVERDELVPERAGGLDAGVDDVGDLLALVGVGLEEVVEFLQLVEDAQEADLVLTGVVDEVRRVAADETGLELGGDVDDRVDLDLEALDLAAEHLVGVVDVVGAVAAVEDGRLDRGVRSDAERVRGALLALRAAVTAAVLAGGRAARYRERAHRRGGDGPAQERPPVK